MIALSKINLKKRILDLSFKHNLSHIGSCLTAVDIIDKIYKRKKEYEPFILSSGHAGLALYVVLEKYYGYDAEKLLDKHGVHPNRDVEHDIWCSTGSLGHGIGIGVGYALSNRSRRVYVVMSDGELAEGSVYEAFNVIAREKLGNMNIHVNYNGWGAYRRITTKQVVNVTSIISDACDVYVHRTKAPPVSFLKDLKAHYSVMTEEDYQLIKNHASLK